LCLVISTVFIIFTVLLTALPCYFWVEGGGRATSHEGWRNWMGWGTIGSVALGAAATLLVGAVTTLLPLRIGFRAFRRLEF
jgi:hypothetical protein